MGYYDYWPQATLEKPIAFIGFPGSQSAAVGYTLAALLGLAYNEIERVIEHKAGQDAASLRRNKPNSYMACHDVALKDALVRKPAGIIVLGDTTLENIDTAAQLRRETTLVYIKRPMGVLFQTVRRSIRDGRPFADFTTSSLKSIDAFEQIFRVRSPSYQKAEIIFDALDTHPNTVAQQLIALLKLKHLSLSPH